MENNFITELKPDERLIFFKTILQLIKIDGHVDERERRLAHELVDIYNIADPSVILKQPQSNEYLLNEIKTFINERKKALFLLRELLIIAHIDDDFDEKEMLFIEQVAHVLNIQENVVLELNKLILDYKLWQQRYKKIMEEG